MPNPSPHKARQAKKQRQHPVGTLHDLQGKLWRALEHVDAVLARVSQAHDDAMTLKASHCLSQVAGQYAKLLEIGELEARVKALEDKVA